MRSGVVLCCPSASDSALTRDLTELSRGLQSRGVSVLLCNEQDATRTSRITDFVVGGSLQCIVIVSARRRDLLGRVQHAVERAGLRRRSVSYLDLDLLPPQSAGNDDPAITIVLVNLARMVPDDGRVGEGARKTVLGQSKLSRRDLLRSFPQILKVECDIPVILHERCGNRSISCQYCREACQFSAISRQGDSLIIDDSLCTECGACARDCPIGAIQSPALSDKQFLSILDAFSREANHDRGRVLLVTCPIGFQKLASEKTTANHVEIVPVSAPCVGVIGADHYLWAARLKIPLLTLCPDTSCPKAAATHSLKGYAEAVSTQFSIGNPPIHLSIGAAERVADKLSHPSIPAACSISETGLSGSGRRNITLNALRELGAGIRTNSDAHCSVLPFFDIAVNEKCNFCELCQRECPEKAIRLIQDQKNVFTLLFEPAACVGCMLCENACPEDAIQVSKTSDLSLILDGNRVTKALDEAEKCDGCGAPLGSRQMIASLERELIKQGFPEPMLETVRKCARCKQNSLMLTHP